MNRSEKMHSNLKLFCIEIVLCVILFQAFNFTAPYPTIRKKLQWSPRAAHPEKKSMDFPVIVSANISSVRQLYNHARENRVRRALGCQTGSTVMKPCGTRMVVTVTCRKKSITCIGRGVISPTCITQSTYYHECGKVFDTACLCKS